MTDYNVTFVEENGLEDVIVDLYLDEGLSDKITIQTTDNQGEFIFPLPDGEYYFEARKSGYATKTGDFEVDGEDKIVEFSMALEFDLPVVPDQVRVVIGSSNLTDEELVAYIEDAVQIIENNWGDNECVQDNLGKLGKFMAAHLITMREKEIKQDQVQDKSITWAVPDGNVMLWLRNSSFGRTLFWMLKECGNEVGRSMPRTFR